GRPYRRVLQRSVGEREFRGQHGEPGGYFDGLPVGEGEGVAGEPLGNSPYPASVSLGWKNDSESGIAGRAPVGGWILDGARGTFEDQRLDPYHQWIHAARGRFDFVEFGFRGDGDERNGAAERGAGGGYRQRIDGFRALPGWVCGDDRFISARRGSCDERHEFGFADQPESGGTREGEIGVGGASSVG